MVKRPSRMNCAGWPNPVPCAKIRAQSNDVQHGGAGTMTSGFATLRRHPRFPIDLETRISLPSGEEVDCHATNISVGGMQVAQAPKLGAGQLLRVEFSVGRPAEQFDFMGEVRSCLSDAETFRVGIKFIEVEEAEHQRLYQLLQREFERREARRHTMRTRVEGRSESYFLNPIGKGNNGNTWIAPESEGALMLFGRDISRKGMRLVSDVPFDPGDPLDLRLKFRLGDQSLAASSVVRWCQQDDRLRRFEIGVEFIDMDTESERFLDTLLSYAER
ncbi:MAG: PilZ domain-containing protein [Candidatus Dadabacteria bacterium]|nr:MAG: PilZ domain-containing protein [Candidatus Dadabacteria bacterium]